MSQGVNMGHGTETGESGRVTGSTHSCARRSCVNTQRVAGRDTVNAGVPQDCTNRKTQELECSRAMSYQHGGDGVRRMLIFWGIEQAGA